MFYRLVVQEARCLTRPTEGNRTADVLYLKSTTLQKPDRPVKRANSTMKITLAFCRYTRNFATRKSQQTVWVTTDLCCA